MYAGRRAADTSTVRLLVALCALCAAAVHAQSPVDPADRIRAAMAESLARQQASVQRQVAAVRPADPEPQASLDCDPIAEPELARLVTEHSTKHELKPDLLRAVIRKESAGKPCAISPKGAQGLMQIMPATAAMFDLKDPFDPTQNIDAGAKFLRQLLTKYSGDVSLALAAYNAGPSRVDKDGGVPKIKETQDYVTGIMNMLGPH
jgi:soluble lytic murein transglycosylase-like protein